ncbi:MAG: ATP-dependent DNA helicase DinG [Treponema sp.]|nr:ATP-dependent DNA helicase DinG [Treponema sp.]
MKAIDSAQIISQLEEGGSVANALLSYEPRKSQLDLLSLIISAFNEDALLMAEAGTGVGKSFAYLLPAMRFALLNKEKVVISTATITLQQQLFEKDIPLVAGSTGMNVKAVLMKGRGNYLCKRRLDDALKEPSFDTEEYNRIISIAEWAEKSKTGSRSELPYQVEEIVWQQLCSDSDMCPGLHCPWRESCFIFTLRREAANADLIVVNHHLLFADLAARHQGAGYENAVVLPPFNRLIIDEAHTIENAATSFFSQSFNRTGIFRQISRLYHRKRGDRRGLLVRLSALFPPHIDPADSLVSSLEKIRSSMEKLDSTALDYCGVEGILRVCPALDTNALETPLFSDFRSLQKKIKAFNKQLQEILEQLDDEASGESIVWEIKSISRNFENAASICGAFPDFLKHENDVLWIERKKTNSSPWAVFTKSPLNMSQTLKESIFAPNKSVICVSATLTVNGDFGYWASRCGINTLENRKLLSGIFPSPFPYSSAVLLASPTDCPLPDEDGYQGFVDRAVKELASVSGGSALVLFTSYEALRSAFNASYSELERMGIRCLKQGDDDRTKLLQAFLSDKSSCLFATASFWEGVDAPGDTLRMVIICRLPFRTPGDPVFEARCEALQKSGGNPFMELSLPQAVMKFKQGFGRLMRRNADHGIVAVLDSRILKKQYGSIFRDSLPETLTSFCEFNGILKNIENFLY